MRVFAWPAFVCTQPDPSGTSAQSSDEVGVSMKNWLFSAVTISPRSGSPSAAKHLNSVGVPHFMVITSSKFLRRADRE